jgi:hypothetical protein
VRRVFLAMELAQKARYADADAPPISEPEITAEMMNRAVAQPSNIGLEPSREPSCVITSPRRAAQAAR